MQRISEVVQKRAELEAAQKQKELEQLQQQRQQRQGQQNQYFSGRHVVNNYEDDDDDDDDGDEDDDDAMADQQPVNMRTGTNLVGQLNAMENLLENDDYQRADSTEQNYDENNDQDTQE